MKTKSGTESRVMIGALVQAPTSLPGTDSYSERYTVVMKSLNMIARRMVKAHVMGRPQIRQFQNILE